MNDFFSCEALLYVFFGIFLIMAFLFLSFAIGYQKGVRDTVGKSKKIKNECFGCGDRNEW